MTFTKVLDMNVHVIHYRVMNLATYLGQNGISDVAFASSIRVSRSMVTKLRHGLAKPSADTALRIENATSGAVKLADLIPREATPRDGDAA